MNNNRPGHKRTLINALLTVNEVKLLSTNLIRIIFSSDKNLSVDQNWIGPHVKLLLPSCESDNICFPEMQDNKIIWQEGLRERVRTYSIRSFDETCNRLTIDFVIHEKGIATTWAQHAKINETIGLITMGSKNCFDQDIQLILLGDISALPAISYTLEHLPSEQKAIAIIEVRDEQDKIAIKSSQSTQIEWIVTPQGNASQLKDTISALNLSDVVNKRLFWGGMESSLAQDTRRFLKSQPELSDDDIHLISYWREGFAEGQFKHHD